MSRRCLALTVAMAVVLLSASLAGAQAPAAEARPKSTAAARWTPPKTPWGHPDLQGEWTSDSARGIPRERPQEFAGRTELTDKELAERIARDEQTIKSAVAATGTVLAVSLEPEGGSPTGLPTGPVLFQGKVLAN